jgi:hypothetical protein
MKVFIGAHPGFRSRQASTISTRPVRSNSVQRALKKRASSMAALDGHMTASVAGRAERSARSA